MAPDLKHSAWYTPTWLNDVMRNLPVNFEKACGRWRTLYRAAVEQQDKQNSIITDVSRSKDEQLKSCVQRRKHRSICSLATARHCNRIFTPTDISLLKGSCRDTTSPVCLSQPISPTADTQRVTGGTGPKITISSPGHAFWPFLNLVRAASSTTREIRIRFQRLS